MAVADLIGAAVGVMLLVIVAYLLVGSTLSTAEIVTNAQKAAALQEQTQLRTDFTIGDVAWDGSNINCTINNTGKEIISDFKHMDVIVYSPSAGYQVYPYSSATEVVPGTWRIISKGQEIIHPSELDPGETYRILIEINGDAPAWFQITTGNGVYDSRLL